MFDVRLFQKLRRTHPDPGMRHYPPRARRDLDVGPGSNSRRVLAPRAPANQQSAGGVGVHTTRGGIDQGNLRFRPRIVAFLEISKDV